MVSTAWAQETDAHQDTVRSHKLESQKEPHKGTGGGYFAIGLNVTTGTEALRDRLSDAGFPALGRTALSIGGGGYGGAGRIIFGGEGHGLIVPSERGGGREVSIAGGYGLGTVGYLLQPASGLRVYPQLGLGVGGLSLDIQTPTAEDAPRRFGDVLENPRRGVEVSRGSLLLSLQAGLEYRFGASDASGWPGALVGLQAGYLFAPFSSDWNYSDVGLEGGPDSTFAGPFLRLIVGG
jgi:hypothetical protein